MDAKDAKQHAKENNKRRNCGVGGRGERGREGEREEGKEEGGAQGSHSRCTPPAMPIP